MPPDTRERCPYCTAPLVRIDHRVEARAWWICVAPTLVGLSAVVTCGSTVAR